MSVIDKLEIISGYFDKEWFIMTRIAGYTVNGVYRADGLLSMARLIDDTPMNFTIDEGRSIFVPVEMNRQLQRELFMIVDEMENKN